MLSRQSDWTDTTRRRDGKRRFKAQRDKQEIKLNYKEVYDELVNQNNIAINMTVIKRRPEQFTTKLREEDRQNIECTFGKVAELN